MSDEITDPAPAYDGPDRRVASRQLTALPITVRPAGRHQLPGILSSLSPYGCTVTRVTLSGAEENVWIRLPGLESQPARCVWRTFGEAGFAFDHALHPAVASRFYLHQRPTETVEPVNVPTSANDSEDPASRRDQILFGQAEPPARLLRHKPQRESNAALMRMVRRRMARVVDQRLEERFPPPSAAVLGFRLAGQPAALRDVSPSGLKAAVEVAGPIGAEVKVAFAGFDEIAGKIVWIREGATGIRLPDGALHLFEAA